MPQAALPGFRDFYPTEFAERAYVMGVWRDSMRRYAFTEYDGPPLEPLDLYRKKSGDELVGQLYGFTDKGGREVAMRPEMTPTFARMVAARANSLRKPVRWFSIPQLFRYERQQKGRLREHFQLNADIVGEAGVTADAELLAVAIDVMRSLGLGATDVVARVSDRRLLQSLLLGAGAAEASLPAVYGVIDKLGREPADVSLEKLSKAAGGDATAERILGIMNSQNVDELAAMHGGAASLGLHVDRLREYFGYLEALGVSEWVRLDLSIVRGLAYYTGIVFELFDAHGEFRAICGGGRYDTLLDTLGGVDLPALGFGMGDVVLGDLLRARGLMPAAAAVTDYWIAADDETLTTAVMSLAARLRGRNRSVEYALKPQALARQLKAATSAGARQAVILLRDRVGEGDVTIRDLHDGEERTLPLEQFINSQ
ncbi:MAG: histidine--tRNA ligase [Gemmatimonadaceae bacterium]|nr:histidine--tRNA ligase [Gemmatimonadaceae bacterium]